MNQELKANLELLEAEFASLHTPLMNARMEWRALREKVAPIEEEMVKIEKFMDSIRHSERYKELLNKLPALREAVGK